MIVVMVELVMAPPTSPVPRMAASATGWPASTWRKMFSPTTMASSTSRPRPRARPPKVMMFNVRLLKYIRLKAATMEIGMDRLMIAVTPSFRRKMNRTMIARMPPKMPDCWTSPMASLMKIDWSWMMGR